MEITSKSELKRLVEQATVERQTVLVGKKKEFVYNDPCLLQVSIEGVASVGVTANSDSEAKTKAYESLARIYFPEQAN